ncbi:hypothetical protein [Glutamicibacter sp. X7]
MILEILLAVTLTAGTAVIGISGWLAVEAIKSIRTTRARDEATKAEAEKCAKAFEAAQASMTELGRKLASGASLEDAAKVAGIKIMSPAEVAADLQLMPCADPNCPSCKGKRGGRNV